MNQTLPFQLRAAQFKMRMTPYIRVILRLYRGYIKVILGLYRDYIRVILGLYKGYIGVMLG